MKSKFLERIYNNRWLMIAIWNLVALILGAICLLSVLAFKYYGLTTGSTSGEQNVDWVLDSLAPLFYGTIVGLPFVASILGGFGILPGTKKGK